MLIGKNRYYPPSKTPVFITNGGHHREPQMDIMLRSTDHGEPTPINTSTPQLLHLWLRNIGDRAGGKTVRARIPGSQL